MTELQQALIQRINELTDAEVHSVLAAWVYGMKPPEATARKCVQSVQSGYTPGE